MALTTHQLYFTDLAHMSLQRQSACIPVPIEPQPLYKFQSMQVLNGVAAFWLNSSCCEIRNCPWGRAGSSFRIRNVTMEISRIEVQRLHTSLAYRAKNEKNADTDKDSSMQLLMLWERLFGKTEYAWKKNPLVWLIYFEKKVLGTALPLVKQEAMRGKNVVMLRAA